MRILLNSKTTFSIIASFTLFSLVCCCLTNIAQADTSETFTYQKTAQEDEISYKENHSDSHKDCRKGCSLDKFLAISKNSSLNNLKFKLASDQNNKLLFTGSTLSSFLRSSSFSIVNQGLPEKIKNTIPIYLQNSILRI
ncbi:hypothetical protein MNBD_UNCLBAC01-1362 [hydrothermal vent metagenome]|uniref:Uncharacterized protein n=1 Tax=hydrothermal vent metagenome TaxID=652676 RepID=A0A3B1DPV3_9ZZZZ